MAERIAAFIDRRMVNMPQVTLRLCWWVYSRTHPRSLLTTGLGEELARRADPDSFGS